LRERLGNPRGSAAIQVTVPRPEVASSPEKGDEIELSPFQIDPLADPAASNPHSLLGTGANLMCSPAEPKRDPGFAGLIRLASLLGPRASFSEADSSVHVRSSATYRPMLIGSRFRIAQSKRDGVACGWTERPAVLPQGRQTQPRPSLRARAFPAASSSLGVCR